ncbi:hypothetical protein XA68_15203 [Ophiocordyceps unilateralis]|uniref:amidase n=1 Tax=Ophiocordyceps unilateralis TaxID=268505 RepID=A0A2A9P8T6_OPHUN|nr:hypothetical protein XA68_15203 [Ophiocordyceps unilateralis]
MFLLDYLRHRRDCQYKKDQRTARLGLLDAYRAPVNPFDRDIVHKPIEKLVEEVQTDPARAADILRTYGKVALRAHDKTNCLTEILLKDAEGWVKDGSINFKGALAGIPVSLKDTIDVKGHDSTVGMSCYAAKPKSADGPMVKMLKDLGAVPYVKTNIPITLLSFESANDVWGRSTNPYNPNYTPGGSTGGEGALLALGGRIGIGSDVAGSVRCPAHFSGIYSLKCSIGRWPKLGTTTSIPGQDGVPAVYSPMARTLNDLVYFTRAVIEKGPWNYDHTCHPMSWRPDVVTEYKEKKTLRVGVFRTDGVIDPSPACKRALEMTEAALRKTGHRIIEIDPPSPYDGLRLASRLLCADGLETVMGFVRAGEWNDRGAAQLHFYARLPRFLQYLHYLWVRYIRRDPMWAGMLRDWKPRTTQEYCVLISQREAYKRRWFDMWESNKLDFIIAPPNATPAVPHLGMHDAVSSCAYTFLFNLVGHDTLEVRTQTSTDADQIDYSAGVIPVTHVDRIKDKLPDSFKLRDLNGLARGAYKFYDADAMHGLPVGVQVIGRRLEEEKVLTLMERVEEALGAEKFQPLEVD